MRRTVPARALAGKPLAFIRQGLFYRFAFADDLTGPSECSACLLQAAEASTWQKQTIV
jgi:hypothetical protein